MTDRTYPYTGWVLQPSFKPVEVTFVKEYRSMGSMGKHYGDASQSGKVFAARDIFPTKEAAIQYGWKEVERIQADLDKRTENLRKKRAALNNATALSKGKPTT